MADTKIGTTISSFSDSSFEMAAESIQCAGDTDLPGIIVMGVLRGLTYNFRGLRLALKTPRLLLLGLTHLVAVVILTVIAVGLVFIYHQDILHFVWDRPESAWLIWLWYLLSWLIALFLAGFATIAAYLLSQVLFSVLIMDLMSRITERLMSGGERKPRDDSLWKQFLFLLGQEIPRTILPLTATFALVVVGWLTPLGPIISLLGSAAALIFLAWDNTDLVPARRLEPFGGRFRFLLKHLGFHLGFGLPFLIPGLNILFLSYAPVGATLYYLENHG